MVLTGRERPATPKPERAQEQTARCQSRVIRIGLTLARAGGGVAQPRARNSEPDRAFACGRPRRHELFLVQSIKGIAVADGQAALGFRHRIHCPSCRFESKPAPARMQSCNTRDPSHRTGIPCFYELFAAVANDISKSEDLGN